MVKAIYPDTTFRLVDPVNLREGYEADLKILAGSEIKKMTGAFKIRDLHTIEEIIESDSFE